MFQKMIQRRWVRLLLLAAAVIAIYKTFDSLPVLLGWIGDLFCLLTPVLIGLAVSFFLSRPVFALEKRLGQSRCRLVQKGGRAISLALVYLLFFAAIALFIGSLLPMLVTGIGDFLQQIPSYLDLLKEKAREWNGGSGFLSHLGLWEWIEGLSFDRIAPAIDLNNQETLRMCLDSVMNVSSVIGNILLGFVFSIYMLWEREMLISFVQRVLRLCLRESVYHKVSLYFHKSNAMVFRYFGGQLLDGLIVGVCGAIALAVLGVPYGVILGLLFGLFNLIPYFGPIFMGVAAVVITLLSTDWTTAIWAAALLLIIQQVDANILNPKILGSALHISPFWVFFAVTLGGGLFGIFGMLVSVPVFAVLRLFVLDYLSDRERKKGRKHRESTPVITTSGKENNPQ